MADETKTPGPRAGLNKKIKRFPGDFENFTKSKEFKESKKTAKDKYEKDKQHPVKGKHAAFDRLDESLGMRDGKESTKSQSFEDRRDESRGE